MTIPKRCSLYFAACCAPDNVFLLPDLLNSPLRLGLALGYLLIKITQCVDLAQGQHTLQNLLIRA